MKGDLMSANSSVHTTTLKSKLSTLHRRQSALNLPLQSMLDYTTSVAIQPPLNGWEPVTASQEDLLPTSGTCRTIQKQSFPSSTPQRQYLLEIRPENCEIPATSSQLFDSLRSRRGSVRTLSRDFELHSQPASSIRHDNLASLKDQFLKIKERFSPSILPPPSTIDAPVPSVGLENGSKNNPTISIPSTSDQIVREPLNRADELSWELSQARVERWYREDDFYKACIPCGTIKAGAVLVSKVARVVSDWAANISNTCSLPAFDCTHFMNPDVSLQWIGRHLWAVTVSVPLSRSRELHAAHLALARQINRAVFKVSKESSAQLQTLPSASTRTMVAPPSIVEIVDITPSSVPSIPSSHKEEDRALTKFNASPCSTRAAKDLCLEQAPMIGYEESEDDGAKRDDMGSSDPCQNDNEEESGSEQASALPLSWSLQSLSSQPSGSSEHASLQGDFATAVDDSSFDPVTHLAPEKLGWLKKKKRKQHGLGSSWQPRYFELKGNRLYYFASEADGLPRGAVLLDHALVQRGREEQSMAFRISSASSLCRLQVLKFSASHTHHVLTRKAIEFRVLDETDVTVNTWIAALKRASMCCTMASALPGSSRVPAYTSPDKKRMTPFYRFRSPTVTKAPCVSSLLAFAVKNERLEVGQQIDKDTFGTPASYQHFGSVQYLRDTDPLLWHVHPPEQIAIRKKAARARTRGEYLAIFARHAETFSQIFLPRPQPITLEQTLRDILPELFLIDDILYGGGEQLQPQTVELSQHDAMGQPQSCRLEHIFEVLDTHIQRFAAAPEERVRAISALLQACARTISGGDSYFVVHRLLGNPNLIIRPAEARGRPIEIDISPDRPSRFLITVFSAFSFHLLDDVERFGDSNDVQGFGTTPAPLFRVRTRHIQEFDFAGGTSTRWLKIDVESRKENVSPSGSGGGSGTLGRWGSRRRSHKGAGSRIGVLLDALS